MLAAHFIVRIYRCEKKNPHRLVGVVEEVGAREKRAFTSYDELWDIVSSMKSIVRSNKSVKKGGDEKGLGVERKNRSKT